MADDFSAFGNAEAPAGAVIDDFSAFETLPDDSPAVRRLVAATQGDVYGSVVRDALVGAREFAGEQAPVPTTVEEDILRMRQPAASPRRIARREFLPVRELPPELDTSIGALQDTSQRFQRGAVGGAGRVVQGVARLLDLPTPAIEQEDRLLRAFGVEIPLNRNVVSRAVGDVGRAIESTAVDPLNTYIDPARDRDLVAQGAELAGSLVPVIASGGTAAPVVGGLMMTEQGAREAEAAGRDVDRAVVTNFLGGTALNVLPASVATRGGIVRRGLTGAATGAGINTAGDVALQLADTGEIDMDRLRQNLAIGGAVGLVGGAATRPRRARAYPT